jgi:hypothetical protein
MSKYSYEFSYYFGIMVSSVFVIVYALYIVYIVVLAGLKFYSDCFYFLYKLYQNDFNFSQTVFIVFKDFVRYFIDDMSVILNNKDNLFSSVFKQLGRVPEEQRGLTIYNRDVEGNPKILDNLAYKFSGLNREALPVAKVTLLGPNAEPLMVYMKK